MHCVDVQKAAQAVIIAVAALPQTMLQRLCKPTFARPCTLITNWNAKAARDLALSHHHSERGFPHTLMAGSHLRRGPAGV